MSDVKFKSFESKFMGLPQQKSPDEKLRDVSNMYEKHFLREMLKAMRSTVHEGGFIQSNQAEKIFREQLDDNYVDKWSERGGIGLSDMIYKQLLDKFGVAMGIRSPIAKPQGPLPLDQKGSTHIQPFQHPGKKSAMAYRIDALALQTGEAQSVKSPWDGVLLGRQSLMDGQTVVDLEHDNGLKSQLVFKGALSKLTPGQKLQAGDTLGFLSSEAKSLYWTVEANGEPRPDTVSE